MAWYRNVLGFRAVESAPGTGWLSPHGGAATLIELVVRPGAKAVPRRRHLGLFHVAILLPDREALGSMLAHLERMGERVATSDHIVSEALYLQDPDNLGIELYADRPRADWRQSRGELAMGTAPLDRDNLISASGHRSWAGMPTETVIGHVHLHVGDMPRAAAFYHDALGFDKTVWSYPGALFLSAGGYHHHLGINTWAAGASPAADDEARLLDWEIIVPERNDLDAAARSLESAGHVVTRADGTQWSAADPWGTRLRMSVG